MLDDLKIIHERDSSDALGVAARWPRDADKAFLTQSVEQWSAVVPTAKNLAKQIALEVIGKTPVIYSGPILAPSAQDWKRGFNQHAKHVAWTGLYPEFLEGELTGWSRQPIHKLYTIIDLRSSDDDEQTKQAFLLAERLLSGLRPAPIVVEVQGSTDKDQLAWASSLGDFVSVYTAILNGVNPSAQPFAGKLNLGGTDER
jgi:glucose/mannose-6-phosphate isomerase